MTTLRQNSVQLEEVKQRRKQTLNEWVTKKEKGLYIRDIHTIRYDNLLTDQGSPAQSSSSYTPTPPPDNEGAPQHVWESQSFNKPTSCHYCDKVRVHYVFASENLLLFLFRFVF